MAASGSPASAAAVDELAQMAQGLRLKVRVLKEAYSKQAAEMEALRQEADAQLRVLRDVQAENDELRSQVKRYQQEQEHSGAGGSDPQPQLKKDSQLMAGLQAGAPPPILSFLEDVAQTPEQQVRVLKQQLVLLNADRIELQRKVQQLTLDQQQQQRVRQEDGGHSFLERLRELEAEYQALPVVLPQFFSLRSYRHSYLCCTVALGIQTMTANRQRAGSWEMFSAKPRGPNRFALITHTGRYVSVRKGGVVHAGSAFVSDEADRNDDKERHVFEFVKGRLEDGKAFRIKCFLGSYLGCDAKGNLTCEDHPSRNTNWFIENAS